MDSTRADPPIIHGNDDPRAPEDSLGPMRHSAILAGLGILQALLAFGVLALAWWAGEHGPLMWFAGALVCVSAVALAQLYRFLSRASAQIIAGRDEVEMLKSHLDVRVADLRSERERLTKLFDSLPFGCIATLSDGRILFSNRKIDGWLGYSNLGLSGRSLTAGDLLVPQDEVADAREDEIVLLDSAQRPLRGALHKAAVPATPATPQLNLWVVRDLVPEEEWHARRGRFEQRFHRFFDAAPVGIVQLDLEGQIVECNKVFRNLFGAHNDKGLNQDFCAMVDEGDRADIAARLRAAAEKSSGLAPIKPTHLTRG